MTDAFLHACRRLMPVEGGWENDPDDPGGETYRGLSRVYNPRLALWALVDRYKARGLTGVQLTAALDQDQEVQTAIQEAYYQLYWEPNNLDRIAGIMFCYAIACEMFDTGVNQGVGKAARYLQRGLTVLNRDGELYPNLLIDGEIGPKTLAALSALTKGGKHDINTLLTIMNVMQGAEYVAIMEANSKRRKYCRGWFSRVTLTKDPA